MRPRREMSALPGGTRLYTPGVPQSDTGELQMTPPCFCAPRTIDVETLLQDGAESCGDAAAVGASSGLSSMMSGLLGTTARRGGHLSAAVYVRQPLAISRWPGTVALLCTKPVLISQRGRALSNNFFCDFLGKRVEGLRSGRVADGTVAHLLLARDVEMVT